MLLFKKKYLEAIRSGDKTQTIRLWEHCRMRSGQRSYIPGVGYIRVTIVEPVKLRDLTDEDAIVDGFSSARALRRELRELYAAELAAGFQAYRVCFEVLPPAEQEIAREERRRRRKSNA